MLILAIGLAVAYYFLEQRREESASPITASANGVISSASVKVVCTQCSGIGKIVDETGIKKLGYRCPVCSGRGSIAAPSGKACQYCRGFGRVPSNHGKSSGSLTLSDNGGGGTTAKRIIAQRCPICEGSGITPKPVN